MSSTKKSSILRKPNSTEKGFSLIELLIIVSFIGVLAAIAISQYRLYKIKAFNAIAKTDLKNGLTAQEAYYSINSTYLSCTSVENCESLLPSFVGAKESSGEPACETYSFTGAAETVAGTSRHRAGDRTFTYDSTLGGNIEG